MRSEAARPPQCPRCAVTLQNGVFHRIAMQLCPSCDGALVTRRTVPALLDRMRRVLLESGHVDPEMALESVRDKGPVAICPRCNAAMEYYGYLGANNVFIDRCKRCDLVWLDPLELAAMSLLNARTRRRQADRDAAFLARKVNFDKVCDKVVIADAVAKAYVSGWSVAIPLMHGRKK